jgi:small subunit ribosomal protein S6
LRGYELMYILDPSLDEDATQALMGQIEDFMDKQGVTLEKTEPWGKRRLAYQIGKHLEGYYVLSHLRAGSGAVAELERKLRVTDGVMRFLTVRVDEEQGKLERLRAKKGITAPPAPEKEEKPAPEARASQSPESESESEGSEVSKKASESGATAEPSQGNAEPTEKDNSEGAEPAEEAS